MDAGQLVPDDVLIAMIAERIAAPDWAATASSRRLPAHRAPRPKALDAMLAAHQRRLDHVIEMKVDDAALVDRITGASPAMKCGASYHDRYKQPKSPALRRIGTRPFPPRRRHPETIQRRGSPPITPRPRRSAYYRQKGILDTVDGMAKSTRLRGRSMPSCSAIKAQQGVDLRAEISIYARPWPVRGLS